MFCNTVQPLFESLQSALPLCYLDDLKLGGEQSVVTKGVERVAEIGEALKLSVHICKCELIIEPGTVVCDPVLQSFKRVPVSRGSSARCPFD